MKWKKPRTDWENYKWFNTSDVRRIFGNLTILNELSKKVRYNFFTYKFDFDKSFSDLPKANEYNKLEASLEKLNDYSFQIPMEKGKTYSINGKTFDFKDLNRIESSMKEMKRYLDNELEHEQRLQFTLGGAKRF